MVYFWLPGYPNERRFFYTSADHLRNSFSHIPSHLAECSACPTEVKVRLEELKVIRNRQKSQLKPGYHKIFIDRVWERLHGCAESDDEDEDRLLGFNGVVEILRNDGRIRRPFPWLPSRDGVLIASALRDLEPVIISYVFSRFNIRV